MANTICATDPSCELYVAKVTESNKFGTRPERVLEVSCHTPAILSLLRPVSPISFDEKRLTILVYVRVIRLSNGPFQRMLTLSQ